MSKSSAHNRSNSKNHGRRPSSDINKNNNNAMKPTNGSGDGANGHVDTEALQNEEFQNHQHDRMLYLIMNSIGAEINVLTNSGTTLTGALENIDPKTLKIVMKTNNSETVTVNYEDVIDFEILSVDLFNNSVVKNSGSFKTDTDISTKGPSSTIRGEDIEKWVPDANTPKGLSLEDMSLEDTTGHSRWDQFKTNEQKFGIKSEFDEHLYTTRIDKSNPEYQKRVQEAERLAREIEGGVTENAHLAEERGIKFDDSGIDEEDKYSGVARTQSTAKGDALFASLINKGQDGKQMSFSIEDKSTKYVPPSQRSRLQNIDPSIISATKIAAQSNKKIASPSPPPPQAPVAPTTETKLTASNKPVLPAKPSAHPSDKSTAYEQAKKMNAMKELNSLKEFAQNFKIPTKFSQDPLPVVAKDKTRQEEIMKKADSDSNKSSPRANNAAPQKQITTQALQPKTQEPTPTPVAQVKPATVSASNITTPVNQHAAQAPKRTESIKKLNPKAAAFTPTFTSPAISSPQFAKNSPRASQANFRKRASFFAPDRVPSAENKRPLEDDFNFFKGRLRAYEAIPSDKKSTPFMLEKPFVTPPTWARDDLERPFKKFFPDIDTSKIPPMPHQQPQPLPQYQTMPMMQPPMFYNGPQFPPVRMSPQPPQAAVLSQSEANFLPPPPQRMQPMYMQPGMPMNGPGPMQYQRYPQPGYAGHPQGGPMPQMMPPPTGRIPTGYKNHH